MDVVIVGAGVIGAAVAYELVEAGYQVAVFERCAGPAAASSGANAGILASGYDREAGSLEASLMRTAAARRPAIFQQLNIEYRTLGALVLAQTPHEVLRFADIVQNARQNGIDVQPLDSSKLREREPGARGRAALFVPEEAITDPFEVTRRLLACARVHYNAQVLAIEERSSIAVLRLASATVTARVAINCAGLHADTLAGDDAFRIVPRRGDFVVYAPAQPPQLRHILRPVDRETGVLVFPTLYGHLCAGPDSVEQSDKEDWRPRGLRDVREMGARLFPMLSALQPVGAWAGLRAAGVPHDYHIEWSPRVRGLLNVAAIRGTGLSAALGISAHVRGLLEARDLFPRGRQLAASAAQFDAPRPWWERRDLEHEADGGSLGRASDIE